MTLDGRTMAEADPLPIPSAGNVTEVVNQVTAHLTADLRFSNASSISQIQEQGGMGNNENHVSIDMSPSPHQQLPATQAPLDDRAHVVKAIWTTSFLTLVPAISTTLYKPAVGVIFGHNKVAYYTMLCAILALGVGEAATAFWLSRHGGDNPSYLAFGRAVLCGSVLPLILVLGIAGYGFMEG